jgi:hypothetical protein
MMHPLYRRLLGPRFDNLPPLVRELHDVTAASVWIGHADVERGRSVASRMVATLFGLPPAGGAQALRVAFEPVDGREIWTRTFGTSVFRSLQYERNGLLRERVGPSTFVFALDVSSEGLALILEGVRFLGVPLPRLLAPTVRTLESERAGRYRFEVEASLPVLGRIVRYEGWLEPGSINGCQA